MDHYAPIDILLHSNLINGGPAVFNNNLLFTGDLSYLIDKLQEQTNYDTLLSSVIKAYDAAHPGYEACIWNNLKVIFT